ncbi:MAG: prepilin-type N-terminal cleavage/methylation domain-containing protein [Desulfamplus sp.]|nr:prepilin-type N-terminal cleavage/methylation domain-containing protein [Desulfamplus sp.]
MTKPDSKGFTIIEVMIAMAIFGIGILGVAKLQITATDGNTTSRTMSEATTTAMDEIERTINDTYDNIPITPPSPATPPPPLKITADSGAEYEVTRTVTTILQSITMFPKGVGLPAPIDLKQITTTVECKSKKQKYEFTTYKVK